MFLFLNFKLFFFLTGIVIILSKLCRNVVLRLSSTKLYLIALNESNSNQISVWSVLDQQSFFKDYDMIGETESNEILFSLPIGMYYYVIFYILVIFLFKELWLQQR